jgi:hypothetical protein
MSGRPPSSLCDPKADIYRKEIFLNENRAGTRGLGHGAAVGRPAETVPSTSLLVADFYRYDGALDHEERGNDLHRIAEAGTRRNGSLLCTRWRLAGESALSAPPGCQPPI